MEAMSVMCECVGGRLRLGTSGLDSRLRAGDQCDCTEDTGHHSANQSTVPGLSWPIRAQSLSLTRSISSVTNVQ